MSHEDTRRPSDPLGFDFSGLGLRIAGLPPGVAERLAGEWAAFAVDPPERPFLDLIVERVERPYDEPDYRPKAMRSELGHGRAAFRMPEGEAEVASDGRCRVLLVRGTGARAYFTVINMIRAALAWLLPGRGGGILHAAAIALNGRVYALVGPSGSGKSTWAALGERGGAHVVSDDFVLLDGSAGALEALGSPLRSTHEGRYRAGRWPLVAILFPRHGAEPALGPTDPLLAEARLAANLPFVADGLERDPRLAELLRRLVALPRAELTFARDRRFLELLRDWPGT